MIVGLTAVLVFLGASLAAGVAPAQAVTGDGRYALGDSVMLGAKWALKGLGFGTVDATESRQAYSGPSELRQRGASLPRNVVIHLGTNGTFPLSVCKSMVKVAGPDRRVFLVTVHVPRSWEAGNNKVIRQCAAAFPAGRVRVIDWDWAASRHSGWLYSDRIHLRPEGAQAFARIIDTAIDEAIRTDRLQEVQNASGTASARVSP